jgi:hypothetical protein
MNATALERLIPDSLNMATIREKNLQKIGRNTPQQTENMKRYYETLQRKAY